MLSTIVVAVKRELASALLTDTWPVVESAVALPTTAPTVTLLLAAEAVIWFGVEDSAVTFLLPTWEST